MGEPTNKEAVGNPKLSIGTKLGYGIGSLGEGLGYCVFYLYFIYFLTDFAGINPALAGTISLLAVFWDAVTDPLVGHLSDHSRNPKGKRRPLIAKACVPLGLMIFLLFTDWSSFGVGLKVAYFFVVNVFFWLAFTLVDIPYMTLGGEITDNPDEKVSLRSYATIFYYIGFIIAASGTVMLLEKFAALADGNSQRGWSWVAALFGLLTTISYAVSLLATRGKEKGTVVADTEPRAKVNIFKSMFESFKIKPYRNLWFYNLFFNIGLIFNTSVLIYLFIYFIGFNQFQISIAYAAYVVMIIIISPLLGKLSVKAGNKVALIVSLVTITADYFLFKVVPLNGVTIFIMQIAIALGNVGFFVCSYAMIYEIADVSILRTGFRNDGVLMAFYQFSYKIATAIGMWLVGIFLSYYKYDATAEQLSDFTLNGIRNMATVIPGLFCLVAIPFLLWYPLSPANLQRLKNLIGAKGEGKDNELIGKLL